MDLVSGRQFPRAVEQLSEWRSGAYGDDFDIVLNDINKQDYPKTIDIAAAKLKKGGLFITDNVIWSGQVTERKQDKTTKKIVEFTEKLYQDSRFFTTILPLRDGISLSIKL